MKAGTDLDCGAAFKSLTAAVSEHHLAEADIDTAVVRLFTARMRLGMFDPPAMVPFNAIPYSEVNSAAHRAIALQANKEKQSSCWKNRNDTLPLQASLRKLAVVGPTADLLESVEGNYNGTAPDPVTPLEGLRKQFGSENIAYAPGSILADGIPAPIPSAYLCTDASLKIAGLKGEYFDNVKFEGAPKIIADGPGTSEFLNTWNRVRRLLRISPFKTFAVRWTGELVPPLAGDYVLSMRGPRGFLSFDSNGNIVTGPQQGPQPQGPQPQGTQFDRVRIYIDDKLVMDSHSNPANVHLAFADTQPHAIRAEYVHLPDDRFVDLEWQPPANSMLGNAIDAARAADATVAFRGAFARISRARRCRFMSMDSTVVTEQTSSFLPCKSIC